MKAVVLVGGFGTRLRPLTLHTPKPLLEVGHRPILELLLDNLERCGVDEAVLSIGFKPDHFREAYPTGTCGGVRLVYAVEPEPLDTGGAIAFAARADGIDDTFVVLNGDVLCDVDVGALVERHRSTGAQATLHLTEVEDPSAFGVVDLGPDGHVRRFVEKPSREEAPSHLVNAGCYVFEPGVLDLVPEGARLSIERVVFPVLAEAGTLFGVPTDDYWLDAGRPDLYLQANLDLVEGRRAHLRAPARHPDAVVHPGAKLERAVVGAGAVVDDGATVVRSVVLPGAVVGPGARLEDSVLGPSSRVGAGATLVRTTVGDHETVDDGSTLVDCSVPA